MNQLETHQDALRLLVFVQVVTMVVSLAIPFYVTQPEEIAEAYTVMEELGESTSNGTYMSFAVILFVIFMGLWAWSLVELYQLNEDGFIKFLAATGLGMLLTLVAGGTWESATSTLVNEVRMISTGGIIYIGIFFSSTFQDLFRERQGSRETEKQEPDKSTGEDE